MNAFADSWIPLRIVGLAAWVCSVVWAFALLVRASAPERHRITRGGAAYLIAGVLGIVAAVALAGQHYSYTDVVINDESVGFDVDFLFRHGGVAIVAAWWAPRLAVHGPMRAGWVVGLAAAFELLRRGGDAALFVELGASIRDVQWVGAVLPPVVAAIGLVAWVRRDRAVVPGGA